jgi:hypothetical protein
MKDGKKCFAIAALIGIAIFIIGYKKGVSDENQRILDVVETATAAVQKKEAEAKEQLGTVLEDVDKKREQLILYAEAEARLLSLKKTWHYSTGTSYPMCGKIENDELNAWTSNYKRVTCGKCLDAFSKDPFIVHIYDTDSDSLHCIAVRTNRNWVFTPELSTCANCRRIESKTPIINDVDMDVLVFIESKGDPNAYNKLTGARGLCQILEPTWNECIERLDLDWNYYEDCNNPQKNKEISWYYANIRIPQMLIYYDMPDSIQIRLSCYNWGIGKVREHYNEYKENGSESADTKYPYPQETKDYINDYMRLLEYKIKGDPNILTTKDIANGAEKLYNP